MQKRTVMIVTDAWHPQINGVVTTLENTIQELRRREMRVIIVEPKQFKTLSLWIYPEIKIAYKIKKKLAELFKTTTPDYVHIATEGPLGLTARQWCIKNHLQFTTAYHTKFPEYIANKLNVPADLSYTYMKWFHSASHRVLVTTKEMQQELAEKGIKNTVIWSRGTDTQLFNPIHKKHTEKPYLLYVGRISSEKNISAFLNCDLPEYRKILIGVGTELESLSSQYPECEWLGAMSGLNLAEMYAGASCFVFPSCTDTFGLVMIEALASGVPVAAFDIPINKNIIGPDCGSLKQDLQLAIIEAIANRNTNKCREWVINNFTWEKATDNFMNTLILTKPF